MTSRMPLPPSSILLSHSAERFRHFLRASLPPLLKTDSGIVFLCGANRSRTHPISVRDVLLEYACKHFNEFRFFRAEDVFEALRENAKRDLLTIEDEIGNYSDCIIIVCDSESAFAELGAFSLKNELVGQVLIINDERFKNASSFITQGPIARADKRSRFKPTVYANFEAVLKSAVEIKTRLEKISRSNRQSVKLSTAHDFKAVRPKLRMLFLADLVHLFFPVRLRELEGLLRFFYGTGFSEIHLEVALLVGLGFIQKSDDGMLYYARKETAFFYDYPGLRTQSLRAQVIRHYFKRDRSRAAALYAKCL